MDQAGKSILRVLVVVTLIFSSVSIFGNMRLEAAPQANSELAQVNQAIVNINKASEEELQNIRGVGPSIATRIVEYREANGKFQTIEDLTKVRGIGGAKFEKMKNQILV